MINAPGQKRFVILDRDGTLIQERNYLSTPEGVEILGNAIEGLQQLRNLGLGIIVVTNQSGVGRGLISCESLEMIHDRMTSLLRDAGCDIDGVYICPHLPEDGCVCRKPKTALVLSAAGELGFEPSRSFVIGDKACDIQLGEAVGATTILVLTGYGARTVSDEAIRPDFVARDLKEAAEYIGNMLKMQATLPPK